MGAVRILWIDLCSQPSGRELFKTLPDEHDALWVDRFENIARVIHQFRPELACVEFDYPDKVSLRAVPKIKQTCPTVPLLMFTEYHSEALAVWAFRSGIWDYRVKPINRRTLRRSIEVSAASVKFGDHSSLCRNRLPEDLIEPAGHLQRAPTAARATSLAVAYIAGHFWQNITRDKLAGICHLSPSAFSRAFRNEHGTTFEHFLLEYRVDKARGLLAEPRMTVSQVAYSSGFNDVSYFSRVFKRLSGITPSVFQQQAQRLST
jgi:AraC-like DNA-binding protein